MLSSNSVLMYAITPTIKTQTITGLSCRYEHAERTKSRKRKENKNSEKGRKIKRTNRRGREAGWHEVSRYLRQEIERKDKWWKNSEDEQGRCRSRHAGGRYESQDKSFHTAIEADFELPARVGWLKR